MYGDAAVIRRRASELREQAVDIRALADRMAAGAESIEWTGRAAEDLRLRMQDRASHLRESAALHETAGDALGRHAVAVGDLSEAISRIERKATTIIGDARARKADLATFDDAAGVTRTLDADDETLLAFTPPPSGHKDWLSVSLPGL